MTFSTIILEMDSNKPVRIKIISMGDAGVGKVSGPDEPVSSNLLSSLPMLYRALNSVTLLTGVFDIQSCIIKRYCEKRFVAKYLATIGIDYGVTRYCKRYEWML